MQKLEVCFVFTQYVKLRRTNLAGLVKKFGPEL